MVNKLLNKKNLHIRYPLKQLLAESQLGQTTILIYDAFKAQQIQNGSKQKLTQLTTTIQSKI